MGSEWNALGMKILVSWEIVGIAAATLKLVRSELKS